MKEKIIQVMLPSKDERESFSLDNKRNWKENVNMFSNICNQSYVV